MIVRRVVLGAVGCALVLTGCSLRITTSSSADASATPAPSAPLSDSTDPATFTRPLDVEPYVALAGLSTTGMEQLAVHTHAHLDVSIDGTPVPIAAGLGISATNPDGSIPTAEQMMSEMAVGSMLVGYSPLHTHDTTGVVHMEAAADTVFTLGQFFDEWGLVFDDDALAGYTTADGWSVGVAVDGAWVDGDFRDVEFADHEEVDVVVARDLPADPPVPGFDFSGV